MKSKFHRAVVVLSAAAAMFVGTDPPASADVGDPGWYVGLRALPAFSQAEDEAIIGGPGGTFRQTSGGLRPSIGGGLGWASNSSETSRTNIVTGASVEQDDTTDDFAYSAMAGVRVAVSRNWVAEVGYRFIDLGEIDSGRFGTGDIVTADTHLAHEFLIGVVYMF